MSNVERPLSGIDKGCSGSILLKKSLEGRRHPVYGMKVLRILAEGCDDGTPGNEAGVPAAFGRGAAGLSAPVFFRHQDGNDVEWSAIDVRMMRVDLGAGQGARSVR